MSFPMSGGLLCTQVGEASVVNVDCSRAGRGQLSLEAVPDPASASAPAGLHAAV